MEKFKNIIAIIATIIIVVAIVWIGNIMFDLGIIKF